MPTLPPTFRPHGQPTRQEQRQEADARRGSARARGYTTRWDKAAKLYRARHPLCLGCEAVGRTTATAVVDHVEPHRGDDRLFWDPDNWQPACGWHHDVVKQRLEAEFVAGRLEATDLRLNSDAAKALTRALDARVGGG